MGLTHKAEINEEREAEKDKREKINAIYLHSNRVKKCFSFNLSSFPVSFWLFFFLFFALQRKQAV